MSIKENGYKILKYLSHYDNNALIRNDEVYTQTEISEHDFDNAAAICFAFKYVDGGKTHIGITAKGRLYLETLEEDLADSQPPINPIEIAKNITPTNPKKLASRLILWIIKHTALFIFYVAVAVFAAYLVLKFKLYPH